MMDDSTIKFWVSELNKLSGEHFSKKWSNTTVHYINDGWVVSLESPKIKVHNEDISSALATAMNELKVEIGKQVNLARTLGLEAAE